MKGSSKMMTFATVILLILSSVILSGCSTENEKVVGIPSDAELEKEYYIEENRAEITVPILNTYKESKNIVVRFMVITEQETRYLEINMLTIPGNSHEDYSQSIDLPENETPDFYDANILVSEDEVGIIETTGNYEETATVNASIANTNPEEVNVEVLFKVITEQNVYHQTKSISLPESSMDVYQQDFVLREGEEPVEYESEIAREG